MDHNDLARHSRQLTKRTRKPRVTKFETALRAAFERTAGADNVTLALRIIRLEVDPATLPLAETIQRPWHSRHALRMALLDSLLGTHGVESLGGDPDSHKAPPFEYLNTGDSYTATVVWYRSSGRFYIRCYGDIVESYRLK